MQLDHCISVIFVVTKAEYVCCSQLLQSKEDNKKMKQQHNCC